MIWNERLTQRRRSSQSGKSIVNGVVRTRYYRCGDEICEGDTVVVPTPMKHTLAIGRAVEIRYCPKDQIPKEMAQAQEILGLAKETE